MDTARTGSQLSPEQIEKINQRVVQFNKGRVSTNGTYVISLSTYFRPYYGFWRKFPEHETPLFIRALAVTSDAAIERAFVLLQNCNVKLDVQPNDVFEPFYGRTDDIISFGKYRGKRLSEIFYIDPSYVLWLANKFVSENKRYDQLVALSKQFAIVYYEITVQKKRHPSVSKAVGEIGERLHDLFLTVLHVRLQVDTYKLDFHVDQQILAVDRDGNRFTFLLKAAARSLAPNVLSPYSKEVHVHDMLHIRSAKVMSHYISRGTHYTRLGYVKLQR